MEAVPSIFTPEWFRYYLGRQALLFDRLWPNETYRPGIVLGLAAAVLPVLLLILIWSRRKEWGLDGWQKLLLFAGSGIFLAAGLIFSVAFVVMAGASGNTTSIFAGIILLVIMILLSVLTILFFVQLLHALKVIKWNARNGTDKGRIAIYVPVVGILLSIATGLSMIPMAPNDYIGLANQAASAAWMLFGSIWLLVYRAKVRR